MWENLQEGMWACLGTPWVGGLAILYVVCLLALWIVPVVLGVRAAKEKGRSPHWMWFGLHPVSGWITYFWLRSARPVERRAPAAPEPEAAGPAPVGEGEASVPRDAESGRTVVGECSACRRPLRVKGGLRPNMKLKCRCGNVTVVNERAAAPRRTARKDAVASLRRLEQGFAGLRRDHGREGSAVFLGGGGPGGPAGTLAVVAGVCADAAHALETGLDPAGLRIGPGRVADGLGRLAADARQDVGLVATVLDPNGVRSYLALLDEVERVAGEIAAG